jgi:AraC-like DNA-binding protein
LLALIGRVAVLGDRVEIIFRVAAMPRLLHRRGEDETHEPSPATDLDDVVLSVPAHIKRTGIATKLVIQGDGSATRSEPDRSLLRLIAQAHRFKTIVMENRGLTVTELAKSAGVSRSYFARVFRLSFLAPDITKAILQNRHPAEFTAHKLMRAGSFALSWADQRRQFGFD